MENAVGNATGNATVTGKSDVGNPHVRLDKIGAGFRFVVLLLVLTSGSAFGWTRYTGCGVTGQRFSDPNTWDERKVPQETDPELQLWLNPSVDQVTFVNDLDYALTVRQLLLLPSRTVPTMRLVGNPIRLGDVGYTGSALQIEGTAPDGGATLEVFNNLIANRAGTCIDVAPNRTLIIHGDLSCALTGSGTSTNSFRFVGAGTKILRGNCRMPDGVAWSSAMSLANGVTRIEGDWTTPGGFDLGNSDSLATLEVVRGGRISVRSGATGTIRNGAVLDICGGIVEQKTSNASLQFCNGTVRVRNGGVLRTGNAYRHGAGGLAETLVETGGIWSCYSTHYMPGSSGGGVFHLTIRGGTVFAPTTYGFNFGYNSSSGATTGTNWVHLAAGGQFRTGALTQKYKYGEAGLDKDVYFYADGGTLVYSPTGIDTYSTACSAFIDGTVGRFHTVVREGGFRFNNLAANVTYNGSIEGNDNGGSDGGLVKLGGAALTLTGVGTYTGTNDVRRGRLVISAANAACHTTVSPIGELELTDAAHYHNGIHLDLGANLILSGAGAYSISSLSAGADAAIALTPANASLTVGSDVKLDGLLRFRLTNAAAGSYEILSAPNAADIVAKCRVLEPEEGKSYVFSCSEGKITLTVGSKTPTAWNLSGGGKWSVDGNWTEVAPNAAGVHVELGSALTAESTLSVDAASTVGGLFYNGAKANYKISGQTLSFASDDASVSYVGGTISGSRYMYLSTPISVAESFEVWQPASTRLYLESGTRSFGGDAPTCLLRVGASGYVYVSGTVKVPTVVERTGSTLCRVMTRDATKSRFEQGLYMKAGTCLGHYSGNVEHKIAGDFRMTEGCAFDYVYTGSSYRFEHPVGALYLNNESTYGYSQEFHAESLADVDSVMMFHATLAYDGSAVAELPRTAVTVLGRSKPGINTISRRADSGDLIIDGGNIFQSPATDAYKTNYLHFAGDQTGRIILKNGFTNPQGAVDYFALDSGKFLLKDDFGYSCVIGNASDVTIGSANQTTEVVCEDGAYLRTVDGRILGDTTLDLSAGGQFRADSFAFAGTLKLKPSDDPYAVGQVSVGTATFAANGTIDFGGTAEKPLANLHRLRVMRFETLSAADEANLRTWTITGSGYGNLKPVLTVDRDAGVVLAEFRQGTMVIVR